MRVGFLLLDRVSWHLVGCYVEVFLVAVFKVSAASC